MCVGGRNASERARTPGRYIHTRSCGVRTSSASVMFWRGIERAHVLKFCKRQVGYICERAGERGRSSGEYASSFCARERERERVSAFDPGDVMVGT